MIVSKTRKDNYISYLLMELLVILIITFLFVGFIIFYVVGRGESKSKEAPIMHLLLDNPSIYALVCLVPALIAVILTLIFRNRNYITGFDFDDNNEKLTLLCRRLGKNSEFTVSGDYSTIRVKKFKERKFILNQVYFGISIYDETSNKKLDLVRNNFIWEKQPREKVYFLEKIEQLSREKIL